MPRTTLTMTDDALAAAKGYARKRNETLGEAVSELVLRATKREFLTEDIGGFHTVRLAADSPRVPSSRIQELQDDAL